MAERKCARKPLAFLISTPLPSSESSVSVSIIGGKENCEEDQIRVKVREMGNAYENAMRKGGMDSG
jgi:predicted DNA-binding protein (UPF0278 family)